MCFLYIMYVCIKYKVELYMYIIVYTHTCTINMVYMFIIHSACIHGCICICGQSMSKSSYLTDLHSLCRDGHLKAILPRREPRPDQRWAPNLIEMHAACIIQDQKTMDTACKTKDKQKQLPA